MKPEFQISDLPSSTISTIQPGPIKPKYGNMLVLLQTNRFLITLGPDYWCFIATFLLFIVAGCYLIVKVCMELDNIFLKLSTIAVVLLQLISYLSVAVSNPGIILLQTLPSQEEAAPQHPQRFCKRCNLRMPPRSYHCKSCDVCIRQYDHHCPWTSKCIGGGNIKRFYAFVSITPFFIVFYIIMLLISVSVNQINKAPQ